MNASLDLFRDGGPFAWAVLLAVVGMVVPALLLLAASVSRARTPGVLWTGVVVVPFAIGIVGAGMGVTVASEAVAMASLDIQSRLASQGLVVALYPAVLGAFGTAIAAALLSVAVGVGSLFGAGRFARLSLLHAAWSALLVLGAFALAVVGSPIGAVVVAAAVMGLLLASLRAPGRVPEGLDEQERVEHGRDGSRVGGARVLAGVFLGVAVIGWFLGSVGLGAASWVRGLAAASEVRGALQAAAVEPLLSVAAVHAGLLVGVALAFVGSVAPMLGRLKLWNLANGLLGLAPFVLVLALPLTWATPAIELFALAQPFELVREPLIAEAGLELPEVAGDATLDLTPGPVLQVGVDGLTFQGEPLDVSRLNGVAGTLVVEADRRAPLARLTRWAEPLADRPLRASVRTARGLRSVPFALAGTESPPASVGIVVRNGRYSLMQKVGSFYEPVDDADGPELAVAWAAIEVEPGVSPDLWFEDDATLGDVLRAVSLLPLPGERAFRERWTPRVRFGEVPSMRRQHADGAVGLDDLAVQGSLTREQLSKVIERSRSGFRSCYERVLVRDPELRGEVGVKLVIGADGLVRSSDIEDGVESPDLVLCLRNRFDRMRFPPPEGGGLVIVQIPLRFDPVD